MSGKWFIPAVACLALLSAGVSRAQPPQPRGNWMLKNYHFTGPPAPGSIAPADPVVSELRQIQSTLMTIMRRAEFFDDFEAAMAAAAQAAANAQLIGTIQERLAAAASAKAAAAESRSDASAAIYSIAFKDHTVEAATAYWADDLMLHYMTAGGAHVQVRLDRVDRELSGKLNRLKGVEFSLPR